MANPRYFNTEIQPLKKIILKDILKNKKKTIKGGDNFVTYKRIYC